MRIDAHQHYWKIDRGDYGWITPAYPVLYRDWLPADLAPHLNAHDLGGSIVVQAAPTPEETDYLLSLATSEASILGVVGWLDLFDPQHRTHYERYKQHPKFAGFRIMIQEMPDASRILEPAFVKALQQLADEDIPIDLLVKQDQLPHLVALLNQVQGLRGVINHLAKPRIAAGELEPWSSHMEVLAGHPQLYCKLSGMVTEADHQAWQPEDLTVYIRRVLDLFGSDRVMFGSDWPVSLLAADYDQVVHALTQALPEHWGDLERAKLFGHNARRFYKL